MEEGSAAVEPRLLVLAAVAGMVSIVALPLTLVAPASALLVFAVPFTLAIAGRIRGRPGLVNAAFVLVALVSGVILLRIGPLGFIPAIVLFAGPVVAAIAVGPLLREVDTVAAAAFLLGGSIAVIAGFASAAVGRTPAAIAVGVASVTALAVVVVRLRGLG